MLLNYHTGLKNPQTPRISALAFIERPSTDAGKDFSYLVMDLLLEK